MKHLLVILLCSTALTGCARMTHYTPSEKAAPYAKAADDTNLKVPVDVPKFLTESEINTRFKPNSIERFASYALSTSPVIASDRFGLASSSVGVAQAMSFANPQVNLDAGGGYTDNGGYTEGRDQAHLGLSATWNFFDNGVGKQKADRERFRTLSANAKLQETGLSVALGSIEASLNVNRHRELVKVYERHLSTMQLKLVQVSSMLSKQVPFITISDKEDLKAKVEQTQQRLSQARQLLRDEEARFVRTVGFAAPANIETPPLLSVPRKLDDALKAIDHHPSIEMTAHEFQAALRMMQSIDTEGLRIDAVIGTVALNLGTLIYNPVAGLASIGTAGIKVSGALLDGGDKDARLDMSIGAVNVCTARYQDINRVVIMATKQAHSAFIAAEELEASTQREKQALEVVLTTRWADYSNGKGDVHSVMDAETALQMAEARLITVKSDRLFSGYRVAAASGTLVKRLKLTDTVPVVVGSLDDSQPFKAPDSLVTLPTPAAK